MVFVSSLQRRTKPKTVRKAVLSYMAIVHLLCYGAGAQTPLGLPINPQQSNTTTLPSSAQYYLEIDTVNHNIGTLLTTDLEGFSTYRVYVVTEASSDQVSAVYGNIDEPSELISSGDIFQSSPLGEVTANGILPSTWDVFPHNQFDSFITIGIDEAASAANGEGDINIIESTSNPWTENFEPESGAMGSGIVMQDITGGSWFVLPNFNNGVAGDDLRVLIAQITTNGTLTGNLHVQIFLGGDNINSTVYLNLPLPTSGCLDPEACNYDPEASSPSGTCTYAEDGWGCDGLCLSDQDGDGICDAHEVVGCTYAAACNFDPNATDEDGSCMFAAPGTDCLGECLIDTDSDGVCDEADPCIGTIDDCGVCNGAGPILDCGCTPIPAGDCDCDGNQTDALGICGGDCPSDSDGDGVCDTQEVMGCTDNSACNYSAEASEEDGSCTHPPDGYDCSGSCLNDADGDGICDAFEVLGCTEELACNYDPTATEDDDTCLIPDACSTCDGAMLLSFDADDDGVCDGDEVPGCTDPEAPNFDEEATEDNGTCKVFGCTDMSASNYEPTATDEDGTCIHICTGIAGCAYPEAENYDPLADCDNGMCIFDCNTEDNCIFDQDGNGMIGSFDLIYFLTFVGLPCAP